MLSLPLESKRRLNLPLIGTGEIKGCRPTHAAERSSPAGGLSSLAGMSHEPSVPAGSEDPTRPEPEKQGRIIVVTYNHIAGALVELAATVGRPTLVLDHREGHTDPTTWLEQEELLGDDSLVVCDHDAPGALDLVRAALRGPVGYVAMMGSRRRAEHVFSMLQEEGFDAATLAKLRVPAGLNIGGKAPGEIALSVLAEIVATSYERAGGPMSADVRR
jgi:xanthine dehydrogenase accessory factor